MNYVDFMIDPRDENEALKMIEIAHRFGYRIIGIESSIANSERIINVSKSYDILLVKRAVLKISTKEDFFKKIKTIDNNCIISAIPGNTSILRYLGHAKRVDLVRIPLNSNLKIDKHQKNIFKIAKKGGIEICLSELIELDARPFLLRRFKNLVETSLKLDLKLLIASCAKNRYELWHPRQVISLLETMGFDKRLAIKTIATYIMPQT
ncbi:MAG: hypothetical protein G5Z42_04655 [Caldisphaeraceae archaeon]|nr:hypothetical protein [Caldisphaeraceae archaeon]MEB3692392.1 hypothetical protein [Caldisphaeraceae archaeon]MEB3798096.1 hypothetical protein [Caldisphaeraceae archaeon]